ncbi:ABC transporter substrate-binding protein [Corynebacterium sp. HMSC06D04]|uniref:ABC transporter substrate-binding protein n=1 Tax=Corynebacterium accolens TaxID=38284 RepID=A0A2A4ALQ7_9CORY|nr:MULTISPECIES: ABC transporter substrate-binding protein [unclassified Corynebacterium]OFM00393.1 ABC transporter substrate-binding protein [Corynebacterium sp. HMSC071F07]OFQ46068.1 ABC transporter substrate-binding protein [Corynebacterium sp. HMSC076D02]OFT53052.1 ABC transporter substrate-binding protein [Corynebacterium sp. HMSC06D04]PCC83409.1 ABC transporter substrate-binding protein [Corynebacterium accolens]
MDRRSFLSVLALSTASVSLTACAGTSSTDPQAKKNSSGSGEVTELTWWSNHPGSSKDIETEIISRFEKENPDIKINLIDAGKNYEEAAQKFNAALTGSDLPDIVVLSDVWWYNFAINGQIANVDELAKEANVDLSSYVQPLYEDYAYDGGHFALPFARSTPLFYYNKDAWKKAGLPDRGPKSWDEMDKWATKLADANPDMQAFGWGDAVDYLGWIFQGPLWSKGGAYSDEWELKFTDPKTIEAVEWLKKVTDEKEGYSYVGNDMAMEFSTGRAAATVLSTGDLSGITENAKFDLGTAFLPNPNGDGACPTGGAGLAIPAGIDKNRQIAAIKFIDFVTNDQNTSYWSQNVGYMPVRKTAMELDEQKKFMEENPNFKTAIEQLPDTRPQDYARVFLPGADQEIGGAFEKIVTNRDDVKKTLTDLEKTLQSIYDNQVKPVIKK